MDFQAWHLLFDNLTIRLFDHDHLWLHLIVHIVLVVMPIALVSIFLWMVLKFGLFRVVADLNVGKHIDRTSASFYRIPDTILAFVARYSAKQQVLLALGALATIPVTYASLELPKRIINYAIDAESYASKGVSEAYSQVDYLLILCGLYLFVLLLNGTVKYFLNYYKGSLAENMIRRLRLFIYQKRFKRRDPSKAGDLVPVIVQEVEPVCGFSGDSIVVPLLQGGTAITIIGFMMVQNIALGAAAITLVPVQLLVIPRFQKRINSLVHQRISLIRSLSTVLSTPVNTSEVFVIKQASILFNRIQDLRLKLFRVKYLSKSVNNFIMNLTPFFFYTIGGYLVIEGKLSMGALVASLASYKDLASSIRELFTYYQSYQDARVRYEEIYKFAFTNRA